MENNEEEHILKYLQLGLNRLSYILDGESNHYKGIGKNILNKYKRLVQSYAVKITNNPISYDLYTINLFQKIIAEFISYGFDDDHRFKSLSDQLINVTIIEFIRCCIDALPHTEKEKLHTDASVKDEIIKRFIDLIRSID